MAFRLIERLITEEFLRADVVLGGSRPWDIEVKQPDKFFLMVAARGPSGFGDAYAKGYWKCTALSECVFRLLCSGSVDRIKFYLANLGLCFSSLVSNKQRRRRSQSDVPSHYNLGSVFRVMLDKGTRSYSCGYWVNANTLDAAQANKIDLVCRKLGLDHEPGKSFLDIGCGWGGVMDWAAQKYGCKSTGITLASDQVDYIKGMTSVLPPGASLNPILIDYRDLDGQFERIASVGMLEHVGPKNYRRYMRSLDTHLCPDGLALVHTIGSLYPSPSLRHPELPWIEKNIFPGGSLPSLGQISTAADGILQILDVHTFDPENYYRTLMAWAKNFKEGWPSIKRLYDKPPPGLLYTNSSEFENMWEYYLYSCAAGFRSGRLKLWQIVLAKRGWRGSYRPIRL